MTSAATRPLSPQEFRFLAHLCRAHRDEMLVTAATAEVQCLMDRNTIRRVAKSLEDDGLIQTTSISDDKAISLLQAKSSYSIGTSNGRMQCQWCKSQSILLHEHHWPIPQRDGGTETIRVCAGCHAEYHMLTEATFYEITEQGWIALTTQDGEAA